MTTWRPTVRDGIAQWESKTCHHTVDIYFAKCWPIFKILSPRDSAVKSSLNIPQYLKCVTVKYFLMANLQCWNFISAELRCHLHCRRHLISISCHDPQFINLDYLLQVPWCCATIILLILPQTADIIKHRFIWKCWMCE